jgi:hypothetical protein
MKIKKKKFIDDDMYDACMMWRDDGKFNNDMMITTTSPKYEKKSIW